MRPLQLIEDIRQTSLRQLSERVDNLPLELLRPGQRSLKGLGLLGAASLNALPMGMILSSWPLWESLREASLNLLMACIAVAIMYIPVRATTARMARDLERHIPQALAVSVLCGQGRAARSLAVIGAVMLVGLIISLVGHPGNQGQGAITGALFGSFTCALSVCWGVECGLLLSMLASTPPRRRAEAREGHRALLPIHGQQA